MNIKKIIYPGLFILILSASLRTSGQDKNGSQFEFEETNYDFGDIQQGEKAEHIFSFKNTGNQPLIISNIVTTCGCTAPTWPKDPVPPGEKGEIKIVFNSSGKVGKQNKIITIFSNSINNKERITVKANIIPGY